MRGEIHGFGDLGHSVRIIAATGRPTGRRKSKFYMMIDLGNLLNALLSWRIWTLLTEVSFPWAKPG